jgi:hypothetical protein
LSFNSKENQEDLFMKFDTITELQHKTLLFVNS